MEDKRFVRKSAKPLAKAFFRSFKVPLIDRVRDAPATPPEQSFLLHSTSRFFMAKILLIISAVITLATAYLGFATKQKVDSLQTSLKDSGNRLNAATADLTRSKTTQKKAEDDLVAAKAAVEEKDAQIAKQKVDVDKAVADLAGATAMVKEKEAEMLKLKESLPKDPTGATTEDVAAKMTELQTAKARLEGELAEARQVQETMNAKVQEAQALAAATQRQVQEYKQNVTRPGISGSVLAYNPGWNFVVLSLGDRQGLKSNAQLVVSRGGEMIGKVRVKSVEPTTSIADIIPGSVPRGVTVQQGDRVVFEGRTQ